MDAKQAADIIKSGNYSDSEFKDLYAALSGKDEFAKEFNALRIRMLKAYAKGDSIEISQNDAKPSDAVLVVEQSKNNSKDAKVQNKDVEPWKIQARNDILQWAAKTKNREVSEIKAVEDGLHAEFKDGTKLSFLAENHVSVKTPAEPKAQNFDAVVALAQKNKKKVKLGENMTPEFRKALIEACATANVQISNLSLEDLDMYMKFAAKPEKQLLNVEENSDSADKARNSQSAQPQQKEDKQQLNSVNRGHSLQSLSSEQLETLHEKGLNVDVYSRVNDEQWKTIQSVLNSNGQSKSKEAKSEVKSENNRGHSLQSLSSEQLEALHEKGFDVDVYSRVNDEQWKTIQSVLKNSADDKNTDKTPVENLNNGVADVVKSVADHKAEQAQKEQKTNAQPAPADKPQTANTDNVQADTKSADEKVQADKQPTAKDKTVDDKKNEEDNRIPLGFPAQVSDLEDDENSDSAPAQKTQENKESDNKPANAGKTIAWEDAVKLAKEAEKKKNAEKDAVKPEQASQTQDEPAKPEDEKVVAASDKQDNNEQKPADKQEIKVPAQSKKKEGFWKKWGRKIRNAAVIAGAVVVTFIAGRSCSGNPTNNTRNDDVNLKDKTELLTTPIDTLRADTAKVDTVALDDYKVVDVPTQWNAKMGITEKQFNNMYKIAHKYSPDGSLWATMYTNAYNNAAKFSMDKNNPMTAEQFLFKSMRVAAWTNHMRANGWAYNHTGIVGEVIGSTMEVIKCNEKIDAAILEKAKIMLNGVGTDGKINVFTFDQIAPGTSKYNKHDSQGWIIGTTNNVMTGMDRDCGSEAEVEFNVGAKKKTVRKVVPQKVVVEEQGDTIRRKLPDVVIEVPGDTIRHKLPDVVIEEKPDTVRVKPEPVVKKDKPNVRVAVGSRSNMSDRPGAEGANHAQNILAEGSDKGLTKSQRAAGKKMAKDLHDAGKISDEVYAKMLDEWKNTKN